MVTLYSLLNVNSTDLIHFYHWGIVKHLKFSGKHQFCDDFYVLKKFACVTNLYIFALVSKLFDTSIKLF